MTTTKREVRAYVAVDDAGIVQAVLADAPEHLAETAQDVAAMILDGYRVESVSLERARTLLYEPFTR